MFDSTAELLDRIRLVYAADPMKMPTDASG